MQQATITTRKHRKSRGKRGRRRRVGKSGGGAFEEENVFLMSKTRSITSGLKSAARD